jgi:hypothetical protein
MVKVLENKKRVFWEALLLTVVVFFLGILIGISFESGKIDEIRQYYSYSEASIMDLFASNNLIDVKSIECGDLNKANFDFANKIYEEAIILEKYESSGKITDGLILEHKKYDLLRTLLWVNEMKTVQKCGRESHTIVYLYEYQPDDLVQKATQGVWSKILFDLKSEYGSDVLLIPIAVDNDLVSLNSVLAGYDIDSYPVLVIDNKVLVEELSSVESISNNFD